MSNYGYGQNRYDDRNQTQFGAGGYGNTAPYDSRPQYDNPPSNQQYGNQPQYNMPGNGRDEFEEGVELKPLVANGQDYGQNSDATSILNECRAIRDAVLRLTDIELPILQSRQRAVINDPDTSPNSKSSRDLQQLSSKVMNEYKNLTERVRTLKSQSGAYSKSKQIEATALALKTAIQQLTEIDVAHQNQLKAQMARQYKIVRPEATDAEAREAVDTEDGQQVFSQALMQGNRRGQATSVLNEVQNRHADIQKIAKQMIQLNELFKEMDVLVVHQEALVINIEQKGEEVVENMDQGNKEIGTAIQSAKNTRKWKWWCLGICVAIIVVIVIIVLLYQFVFGPNAKDNRDATQNKPATKRWVLPSADAFTLPASFKPCHTSHKASAPVLEVAKNFELIRKAKRFQS